MIGPGDFGPIYAETDLGRFPVEPWNTYSNLIFLFVIVYFAKRTKLSYKNYPLIVGSLPVLLIGYVGGTMFHATRAHSAFLIMDFVPIGILCIVASLYFWAQLIGNAYLAALSCLATVLLPRLIAAGMHLERGAAISLGYSGLAAAIILPALMFEVKQRIGGLSYLIGAFGAFAVAIAARVADKIRPPVIAHGTHFLWHIFGGISVYCLMSYLLKVEPRRNDQRK